MKAGLRGRFLAGAIGGIIGTAAAMRRLHRRLLVHGNMRCQPREISEKMAPGPSEERERDLTVLTHFWFRHAVVRNADERIPDGTGRSRPLGLVV
jgi:hypothetical protein